MVTDDPAPSIGTLSLVRTIVREVHIINRDEPDNEDIVASEYRHVRLITTIDRQAVIFLCPVILPNKDGSCNN